MTGNIIVSTCCLGDMAVNAPSDSGAFTAISPSQTCANYYQGLIYSFSEGVYKPLLLRIDP